MEHIASVTFRHLSCLSLHPYKRYWRQLYGTVFYVERRHAAHLYEILFCWNSTIDVNCEVLSQLPSPRLQDYYDGEPRFHNSSAPQKYRRIYWKLRGWKQNCTYVTCLSCRSPHGRLSWSVDTFDAQACNRCSGGYRINVSKTCYALGAERSAKQKWSSRSVFAQSAHRVSGSHLTPRKGYAVRTITSPRRFCWRPPLNWRN